MPKYFIITVDTEGDNLWKYHSGDTITTYNARFIPRFQELCNQYGFPPVYLTNYEMIKDDNFANYIKGVVSKNLCEVGIHIHAWNNPPLYNLGKGITDNTYLIEYPIDVMREKFSTTYNLISERIGIPPVSHRAGRWAMDENYFLILKEHNILVDCSHTPHINWTSSKGFKLGGSDYSNVNKSPSFIKDVLEVPVTVFPTNNKIKLNLKSKFYYFLRMRRIPRKTIWLRPAQSSLDDMIRLVNEFLQMESIDYLEFMIHSSELMPSGSPYFQTEEAVEKLYSDINTLFDYVSRKGYVGCTLKQYRNLYKRNNE